MFWSAAACAQDFEGVVESVMESPVTGERVTLGWTVKGRLFRLDYFAEVQKSSVRFGIIRQADRIFMLMNGADGSKEAMELEPPGALRDSLRPEYAVELLGGRKTVAGVECINVRVVGPSGTSDVWLAPDIRLDFDQLPAYVQPSPELKQMFNAGVSGFPLEVLAVNAAGKTLYTLRTNRVEKRAVPDDAFVVPAEYRLIQPPVDLKR
ncbi:MAG: DUF4412 domain-containing protein [Bacteroidia bacterium]|nr:DUF4412 domain-containing protein [Bacteroidia bacterium]